MGQVPEWVRPIDNVTIWAILEDDGGIASASVVYTADEWNTTNYVPMLDNGAAPDDVAGDMAFNGTIGNFTEGTLVEYYVSIRDTLGQNTTSPNVSFISSFDQPPIFGGVYRDIEVPRTSDSVRVIANVTDDFMLVNVTLVYNIGAGNVTVNMTKNARGNYEAYIPAFPKLTRVSYYVNATDNVTHIVTYPSKPATYLVNFTMPTVLYATGHGEFKGSMNEYFANVVQNMGYYFVEDDINNVDLDWVEFIIINDPDTKYTTAELAVLKTFVENGGGLMVLSETDYLDYGRPENCNPILAYMGIQGRFNDDGYQDDWYCFDMWNYSTYSPYIPYFNYNSQWNHSYTDLGCFANDTTGITDGVMWMEGRSVSSLILNSSTDTVVVRGSVQGYSFDNDPGNDGVNEAWYKPFTAGSTPPIMAAHTGLGSGRIIYAGMGSTLGDGNYYGWTESNVSEFSENLITWLVNTPLISMPTISGLSALPATPTSSQSVTVSTTVTGVGQPISRVTLRYSVNGSYYVGKEMALSAGKYTTTIPKQAVGAVVTYYIQVVDTAGNYGYWPTEPGKSGIGWYVVQGGNHIVLSEIAYNPRGNDPGHEFIELYNPLPAAVSLEGWTIQKQRGSDNSTNSISPFPKGSMIPAFGYFMVGGSSLDEIIGIDALLDFDFDMVNSPPGMGLKLFNSEGVVVDKVAYIWSASSIPTLDPNLWESYPYIAPSPDDGSFERKPTGVSNAGNYQDTNNNSADFAYRYFEGPQGSWSPSEYPPWTSTITSPFLLPDNHPKFLATSLPNDDSVSLNIAEPISQDAAFVGPIQPAVDLTVQVPQTQQAGNYPTMAFQARTAPGRNRN